MSTLGWRKGRCKRGHIDPPRNKHGACIPCEQQLYRDRYQVKRESIISNVMRHQKENVEARRDHQRAWRMSVGVDEIRAAIAVSKMSCECCGKELTHATLCVDHDHATGKIRGILCRFCNALEGMLNKQPERVLKLVEYLRQRGGNVYHLDEAIKRLERKEPLF